MYSLLYSARSALTSRRCGPYTSQLQHLLAEHSRKQKQVACTWERKEGFNSIISERV